jgi:hypothetical protein
MLHSKGGQRCALNIVEIQFGSLKCLDETKPTQNQKKKDDSSVYK